MLLLPFARSPRSADDAGDSDSADDADDAGDSADVPDPACFEIHTACVAQATTIAEVDACEVLLDHCVAAEPCDDTCEPVCPDPGVSAWPGHERRTS